MKRYLQSFSATETDFCLSSSERPNKTHRLPIPVPFLPVHSLPLKWAPCSSPKKQISGRRGGEEEEEEEEVEKKCGLAALASNLCDTSQPLAFLLLLTLLCIPLPFSHTRTCTPSLGFPLCLPSPLAGVCHQPHTLTNTCVSQQSWWLRLFGKQGGRIHNTVKYNTENAFKQRLWSMYLLVFTVFQLDKTTSKMLSLNFSYLFKEHVHVGQKAKKQKKQNKNDDASVEI